MVTLLVAEAVSGAGAGETGLAAGTGAAEAAAGLGAGTVAFCLAVTTCGAGTGVLVAGIAAGTGVAATGDTALILAAAAVADGLGGVAVGAGAGLDAIGLVAGADGVTCGGWVGAVAFAPLDRPACGAWVVALGLIAGAAADAASDRAGTGTPTLVWFEPVLFSSELLPAVVLSRFVVPVARVGSEALLALTPLAGACAGTSATLGSGAADDMPGGGCVKLAWSVAVGVAIVALPRQRPQVACIERGHVSLKQSCISNYYANRQST